MNTSKLLKLSAQGEYTLPMTQQSAWQALNDPEVLQLCIKGCNKVVRHNAQNFSASFHVNFGVMKKQFSADLIVDDRKAPDFYTLTSDFNSTLLGQVAGHAQVHLKPFAANNQESTHLHYDADIEVDGWLARMGASVLDEAITRYMHRFFENFHQIALDKYGRNE